ncbi:hypothetical protein DMH15_14675 [Streptomyces sp. WAC 06725]|nr:hypothetical protein DMH15_14675 [Streptomyces sp. WAC 06725]
MATILTSSPSSLLGSRPRATRRPAWGTGARLRRTGWTPQDIAEGAALMTETGQFNAGGRALYEPRPGDVGRWDWGGAVTSPDSRAAGRGRAEGGRHVRDLPSGGGAAYATSASGRLVLTAG